MSGILSDIMTDVKGTGSGFFSDIMTDMKGMEQNLLGPDYLYWKRILKPSDMGMSDDGNFGALANNIGGLINYVEVMVSGKGGSTTGGPLGDKFFLKTGGQCTDVASKKLVDRYIYVNNIPSGNIPFISSGLGGTDFTEFEGLIPGTLGDLGKLNPLNLFKSFMMGENPPCMSVTLATVTPVTDANLNDTGQDNNGTDTKFVAVADVKNMDPCTFSNKINPADPTQTCSETFINSGYDSDSSSSSSSSKQKSKCKYSYAKIPKNKKIRKNKKSAKLGSGEIDFSKLPDDLYVKAFYACISIFSLYVLYRFIQRYNKK
jgi:hypothetical protein